MDPALAAFLVKSGLVRDIGGAMAVPLTGGVASDIWRVQDGARVFAVKRALEKLRVAQDWRAPVGRNVAEADWLRVARVVVPDFVPRVLARDRHAGLFAMEFLDSDSHPVWKRLLSAGHADPNTAAALGCRLAALHRATAGRAAIARRFDHATTFAAIRIEPYLGAVARAHPDLAPAIDALARDTLACRRTLVHGDVSPKNILVGPHGPVLLDAECACYGDPAFDAAFCLNHLLLKCVWRPDATDAFLACFDALADAYLDAAAWEDREGLERRITRLLPALLLARVDGKSPVEYLVTAEDTATVRRAARAMMEKRPERLPSLRQIWREET